MSPPSRMVVASDTDLVTVLSSAHGRQRRSERLISKRDLQAAVKYGERAPSYTDKGELRWMYTFRGIVYITDETSRHEITSWPLPAFGFDVPLVDITQRMLRAHRAAKRALGNPASWTSHTVAVVDQSGSMRNTDVDGGATRSDAVWLTLALTWVDAEIKAGNRTSTDVMSVVSMRNNSEVVVDAEPVDWILFNKLVGLLRESKPTQGGNYLAAIDLAERCLMRNTMGSCATALLFFSDGRPSERMPRVQPSRSCKTTKYTPKDSRDARDKMLASRIGQLASRFGRRLTVGSIGFADPSEEFSTLQAMTKACEDYGCQATFHKPSLTAESLQSILSNLSSTLTTTKTELTELGGSKQRTVRDVKRESYSQIKLGETHVNESDWWIYKGPSVTRYKRVEGPRVYRGNRRFPAPKFDKLKAFEHEKAFGIAHHQRAFGEGAERLVYRLREIDRAGKFVGPWLVAKQSRFVEEVGSKDQDVQEFHRTFCATQQIAARIAKTFNRKLGEIPGVKGNTPRIEFLECHVLRLYDRELGEFGVLTEKMLDHRKYKKWNSNNGYVAGMSKGHDAAGAKSIEGAFASLDLNATVLPENLGAIVEEDEEGEEWDDSDASDEELVPEEDGRDLQCASAMDHRRGVKFSVEDIPQAFSCFSYKYSKRKYLVCDLQGVLDQTRSPPCFELTDPVIHYRSNNNRKNVFGRTDRGQSGMDAFFKTHTCSELCHALGKVWKYKHIDRVPRSLIKPKLENTLGRRTDPFARSTFLDSLRD